jgi:hypothetical protein
MFIFAFTKTPLQHLSSPELLLWNSQQRSTVTFGLLLNGNGCLFIENQIILLYNEITNRVRSSMEEGEQEGR